MILGGSGSGSEPNGSGSDKNVLAPAARLRLRTSGQKRKNAQCIGTLFIFTLGLAKFTSVAAPTDTGISYGIPLPLFEDMGTQNKRY